MSAAAANAAGALLNGPAKAAGVAVVAAIVGGVKHLLFADDIKELADIDDDYDLTEDDIRDNYLDPDEPVALR